MVISMVTFVSTTGTIGAPPDTQSETQSVLNKATEELEIEISLGQLAAQRASNEQVKEFGEEMVQEHKKVGQQVELLALKQGLKLSPSTSHKNQQKLEELSRLSGHAFDREYMNYSMQNHETTVEEFERRARMVQDQDIKQWITVIVPILESHREKARRVKDSLQTNP
jgi:putative membrane protein